MPVDMQSSQVATRPRIVVVGSINMDLVVRSARLPLPGETLIGKSLREIPGGKGANQAVAAARLGADVRMIGCVGDDSYGTPLRRGLEQQNVNVGFVSTAPDCASGLAVIGVDDSGQNSIVVIPGANQQVGAVQLQQAESAFVGAQVLLLQLEIPVETVVLAAQLARKHKLITILDPAPASAGLPTELLAADVVCPNETEAALLTGIPIKNHDDAARAVRRLCELGARHAVITLGADGVIWCDKQKVHRSAAFPIHAVDSTAAGDAFAAALGIRLAEGAPFDQAVRFACAAGAVAASREGAQPAMPSRQDVDGLLTSGGLSAC